MDKIYFEYGQEEIEYLSKKDKKLGAAIERIGHIKREVRPDIFAALVKSIISQQISTKAADTVWERLNEKCEVSAKNLHGMTCEEVQSCGMSMRKAEYIKNIAEAGVNKTVDFDALLHMSDQEVIEVLTALKGVGVWTVEMLLTFSLCRPNIVSYGDLAIRRGMMRLYGHSELPKERFERYAKRYAPYGSVASFYLWEISAL